MLQIDGKEYRITTASNSTYIVDTASRNVFKESSEYDDERYYIGKLEDRNYAEGTCLFIEDADNSERFIKTSPIRSIEEISLVHHREQEELILTTASGSLYVVNPETGDVFRDSKEAIKHQETKERVEGSERCLVGRANIDDIKHLKEYDQLFMEGIGANSGKLIRTSPIRSIQSISEFLRSPERLAKAGRDAGEVNKLLQEAKATMTKAAHALESSRDIKGAPAREAAEPVR